MTDVQPLIDEIRARLATTFPEVLTGAGGGGIKDAERADQIAWAQIPLPYIVILIDVQPRGDWSGDRLAFEPPVDIFYVAYSTGAARGVRAKLKNIIAAFWPVEILTTGQVLDVTGFTTSNSLIPNRVFVEARHLARAGMVRLKCLIEDV